MKDNLQSTSPGPIQTLRTLAVLALPVTAILLSACKGPNAEPKAAAVGNAQAAQGASASASGGAGGSRVAPDTVIAKWEGGQITYGELRGKREASFKKLESKFQKDLHELEQRELESYVIQTLVQKAATAAGKTEDQYLQGVAPNVTISDEDIASFYDKNVKQSGQPLEPIKEKIRQYLQGSKQQEAVRAHFEKLKSDAKVSLSLPEPEVAAASFDLAKRPFKGKPDAKVTLVAFSDFQCPYCSQAVRGVEEIVKAYPDDVKVYFLNFPLSFHPAAMPAAKAAECAHRQGKFWEFHDKVFANQGALSDAAKLPDLLKGYASDVGLDAGKYASCLGDASVQAEIEQNMKQGEAAGVEGTPSFYINGRQYSQGVPTVAALKTYVDKAKAGPR